MFVMRTWPPVPAEQSPDLDHLWSLIIDHYNPVKGTVTLSVCVCVFRQSYGVYAVCWSCQLTGGCAVKNGEGRWCD